MRSGSYSRSNSRNLLPELKQVYTQCMYIDFADCPIIPHLVTNSIYLGNYCNTYRTGYGLNIFT